MRQLLRGILIGCVGVALLVVAWIGFDLYRDRLGTDAAFGAPFTLVSTEGGPITQNDLRGHPSTLFFGYTHCPDVCPTTLAELGSWLKKLGPADASIHSYFITVDPERDTMPIMKDYVANVSDRITGVTGSPLAVRAMLKAFGIYYRKVRGDNGDYAMDHTASVILLDSAGHFRGTIGYGEDPDAALAKLKRLASE